MKLTRESDEQLWRQFNGTGVVFLKLTNSEIAKIEFNIGRNGRFYTSTSKPIELTEYLYGLVSKIEAEDKTKWEKEGRK